MGSIHSGGGGDGAEGSVSTGEGGDGAEGSVLTGEGVTQQEEAYSQEKLRG